MFKKEDRKSRRNLKKRVISILLSVTLAVLPLLGNLAGLFPVTVSYAENWTSIQERDELGPGNSVESGYYILNGDLTGDSIGIGNNKSVTFDLNGRRIDCTITVTGTLTIMDSIGGGYVYYISCNGNGNTDISGGTVLNLGSTTGAHVNLSGGTVTGTVTVYSGTSGDATFLSVSDNATISGNITVCGANATLQQSGGTITGTITETEGGSVSQTGGSRTSSNNHTITFDSNGGTALSPNTATTLTYVDGEKLSSLPTPTWDDNHSFNGWYTTADGDTQVDTSTVFTSNSTIYAHWTDNTPATYTITFDANGGTVSPTSGTTGTDGKLSSIPTPTWAGHNWAGWFTAANAPVNTNTVFTGNTTIYALWTVPPATYTITFNPNGGSVNPTSGTTGANGKLASIPTPTWAGHTCTGWFTDPTGGTEVDTNTEFNSNDTIYAHWEETASSGPSTGPAQAPVVVNTPERTEETVPEAPVINPPKVENKNDGDQSVPTPERSYWETNYGVVENFLNNLKAKGKLGAAGQSYVIKLTEGNSLDLKTLELLKKYPFLTIDYQFIYKGKKMRALIPGALVFTSPTIKYYGPEWLYAFYGVLDNGTPVGLFYLVPDLAMQLIK